MGIARNMQRVLKSHEVLTALDGRQALEILEEDRNFDVVFCDLYMPEVTGMEVFEEVENRYPELTGQFVFITGGAMTSGAREFIDRIANSTLEKPLESSEILKIVDDAIG